MGSRVWFDRILMLLGVWLVLTAFVFPPPGGLGSAGGVNALVVGLLLVALAGVAVVTRARWPDIPLLLGGLWLVVAPWLLGYVNHAFFAWIHVIVGIITVLIAASAMLQKARRLPGRNL